MSDKNVSIIVPMYNAKEHIRECVLALINQDYKEKFEIIIIDDGSYDNCINELSDIKDLKIIRCKNQGPANARNLGAKHASYNILAFTDSDCIAPRDWLTNLADFSDDIIAVSGSYNIKNTNSRLALVIHLDIRYRHLFCMNEFVNFFGSYNFAIKKESFLAINGLDTSYKKASAEDNDFSYRLMNHYPNKKIKFKKETVVYHYHPENILKYLKTQYMHGYWRVRLYSRHPKNIKGDGYTIWKDYVGVIFMALMLICLVVTIFEHSLIVVSALFLAVNFLIHFLFFTFKINHLENFKVNVFYAAYILTLRDIARLLGILIGLSPKGAR